MSVSVNAARLLGRLKSLGEIGRDEAGRLVRLAGSDADKAGRDQLVVWLREAGLEVAIDRLGNIFGIWCPGSAQSEQPFMMGSLVHAGGMSAGDALAATGIDGSSLGAELRRIGYAGTYEPGFLKPGAYVELHIEQGPVLESEAIAIGVVENLQGISWQRITIEGEANHAGTTPMALRRDAGHAAARTVTFLRELTLKTNAPTVATVGSLRLEPGAINVISSRAVLTVDLRDPDARRLEEEEKDLAAFLEQLAAEEQVAISAERLARTEPVRFDEEIVQQIEEAANGQGFSCQRMTSGAGHDAQMIARIAPPR